MPLERVEAELCTLAGQIAAANARFLMLLADFDEREGWAGWGIHSCAHWLSWRCGMSLHTAHEHVRVARALATLPKVAGAFGQGRISYSKVRTICRVAGPDSEEELLEAALTSPTAQLERLVRGIRKAQRSLDDSAGGQGDPDAAQAVQRPHVQWRWDDDGTLRIWGQLSAEDGARLLAGLARMDHERRCTADATDADPGREETPGTAGDGHADAGCGQVGAAGPSSPQDGTATRTPSMAGAPPADLGPALVAGAELMCATVDVPVHSPAADVVVHVDARTVAAAAGRLDDGPALGEAVVAMLACSGRTQLSVLADDGRTVNLGRRRRRPNRTQLDALWRRDRGCAHPGCGRTRFLHAHHVVSWATGGPTDLDNLVLLRGEHHRSLHEGGFSIVALGKQRFRFHGPRGAERPPAPRTRGDLAELTHAYADIRPGTIEPDWDGSPLDLPHATDVFLHNWSVKAARRDTAAGLTHSVW